MEKRLRVYFDYNVYDLIQRNKFSYTKRNDIDVFLSVSHVEEFFKAKENDVENKNEEKLQNMQELMKNLSKSGILLKPSKSRIVAQKEAFEVCLDREKRYDTRENVEKNGRILWQEIKSKIEILQKDDSTTKNNSNLSKKEIWERLEVTNELKEFGTYYERYKKCQKEVLINKYGYDAMCLINERDFPKEFQLKYKCFEKNSYSFALLELVIEYLNNVLCGCGYNKDRSVAKTCSGIHDVSHIIYSSYCNYFVSCDKGLVARANAIYEYLGLETQAISVKEFENMLTNQA